MTVKIICCYAHEDEQLLKELKMQFAPLERRGLVDIWYDRDISAGKQWEQEIDIRLNTAQIILLLVSPYFIASNYCYSIEMKKALERHERKEAVVIPVILRFVHWQETPLEKLQALPTDAKPVISWQSRDEAFFDVVRGVRKTINELPAEISSISGLTPESGTRIEIETTPDRTIEDVPVETVTRQPISDYYKLVDSETPTIYGVNLSPLKRGERFKPREKKKE